MWEWKSRIYNLFPTCSAAVPRPPLPQNAPIILLQDSFWSQQKCLKGFIWFISIGVFFCSWLLEIKLTTYADLQSWHLHEPIIKRACKYTHYHRIFLLFTPPCTDLSPSDSYVLPLSGWHPYSVSFPSNLAFLLLLLLDQTPFISTHSTNYRITYWNCPRNIAHKVCSAKNGEKDK